MDAMLYEWQNNERNLKKSRRKDLVVFGIFSIFLVPCPVACIVLGIIYYNKCSLAHGWIQVYVIVLGVNCLLVVVNFLITDVLKLRLYCSFKASSMFYVKKVFHVFYFVWLALGCYWIYSNFEPEYTDTENTRYCHSILYGTSFFGTAILVAFLVFYYLQRLCFHYPSSEMNDKDVPIVEV